MNTLEFGMKIRNFLTFIEKLIIEQKKAKTVIKISRDFPERLIKILDFLFADNDGINSFEKRSCWKYSNESLKELYYNLGFNKIYNILDDYIGVWEA